MAESTLSDRGFKHYEAIETDRATVRVYESSDASAPHLWLNLQGEGFLGDAPRSLVGTPHGVATASVAAHLTLDQAVILRVEGTIAAARERGLEWTDDEVNGAATAFMADFNNAA